MTDTPTPPEQPMTPDDIRARFARISPTYRQVDEDGFDALDETPEEWAERIAAEEDQG